MPLIYPVRTKRRPCRFFNLPSFATAAVAIFAIVSPPPVQAASTCEGVAPVSGSQIRSVAVIDALPGGPLGVTSAPGDRNRLFVLEQTGFVRVWHRGDAPSAHSVFLDISARVRAGGERGLLGFAFDPDYATNGYFYLNYTADGAGDTVVSRFSVSATDPDQADPDSEFELIRFAQPAGNHNAGAMAFGPDGYLYIATGDGGGANDNFGQCGNGQETGNLFGGILRIAPNASTGALPDCGGQGYRIPAGQKLADGAGGDCDELWAYGLRNPWRFDVDPQTGELYIGDVGQRCWEEVNWVAGNDGGDHNFGWRTMEGSRCFDPANSGNCAPPPVPCGTYPDCNDPSLILPVAEHPHAGDCAIIGGSVYRGCRLPALDGVYFYGDRCSGAVRSLRVTGGIAVDQVDRTLALNPTGALTNELSSFGRDADGEVYLVDQGGTVFKIAPPFASIEVSGPGADEFRLDKNSAWRWEDVQYENLVPVAFYRIYRGTPGEALSCVHSSADATWTGDPIVPAPGDLFGYLVTAVDPSGAESWAGATGRQLLSACAAP